MLLTPILAVLGLFSAVEALPRARQQSGLDWQPCRELNRNITILNGVQGSPFDCAKLSVPLDYTNASSEPLELSLFRVNATKQPVLGSVLINFGGPGGSGAENLPVWAKRMASNIGEQYNLISWDPRGTGKTLPFICAAEVPTNPTMRKRATNSLVSANLTEYFLNGGWEFAESVADLCYASMNQTGQYIGTAFTARDMIKIVDALNEDGLLRYYGWSYGTALGSYVSAMFPERVERVVLDANLNPHDYQSGTYGAFHADADKAFAAFLQECINNKDDCALASYLNANSSTDLLNALNLLVQPLAANASSSQEAWTLYSAALQLVYGQLYYPSTWPALADTLTSVLNGTYNPLASTTSNSSVEPYNLGQPWNVIGIRASDALWRTNSSQEYLPTVEFQESVSSFDNAYQLLWVSARWRIDAKERYTGNFSVKTKHPILYVNGEYDPVCPLINAYNASKSFEGSVVLPHSGYGHGVVVDPSACMSRYIQAYFRNGTLPEAGAHCQPDQGPWQLAKSNSTSG